MTEVPSDPATGSQAGHSEDLNTGVSFPPTGTIFCSTRRDVPWYSPVDVGSGVYLPSESFRTSLLGLTRDLLTPNPGLGSGSQRVRNLFQFRFRASRRVQGFLSLSPETDPPRVRTQVGVRVTGTHSCL